MIDSPEKPPFLSFTPINPDTLVINDPNAKISFMPKGFDPEKIKQAHLNGEFATINPDEKYVGQEDIESLNFTPLEKLSINIPFETAAEDKPEDEPEPFNHTDPEYDIKQEQNTQPLRLEDLPSKTQAPPEIRTIGQDKPKSTPSPENKFVNYIATQTKKEGTEVAGREVFANDQFRVVREENGNYAVIYKNGLQAIALKNGNRMIVTVMQTGKGARSEGATYNKYDITLQNTSIEEAIDDENQELRTRLTMGQRFGKMAHSILDPLLPYLESPETVSIDQKTEMTEPPAKKSRFGWLSFLRSK